MMGSEGRDQQGADPSCVLGKAAICEPMDQPSPEIRGQIAGEDGDRTDQPEILVREVRTVAKQGDPPKDEECGDRASIQEGV